MIIREKTKERITTPKQVYTIINAILQTYDAIEQGREHFYVLGLNARNMIEYIDLVSIGTSNQCLTDPIQIYRLAVTRNVKAIILAHNHPSGDNTPSSDDITITDRLEKAGQILGIKVSDHLVIGDGYFSMKEEGYIS